MRLQTMVKVAGIFAVCLAMGTTASAQYGGGGTSGGSMGGGGGTSGGSMGSGAGNTSGYGSSSGKAIGIGVGVAAAAGIGIALLMHHHHQAPTSDASLIGCTQPVSNGISLKNEKDGATYMILSRGVHLQPGERVEVKGVVTEDRSGAPALRVRDVVNNYGVCNATVAFMENPGGEKDGVVAGSK